MILHNERAYFSCTVEELFHLNVFGFQHTMKKGGKARGFRSGSRMPQCRAWANELSVLKKAVRGHKETYCWEVCFEYILLDGKGKRHVADVLLRSPDTVYMLEFKMTEPPAKPEYFTQLETYVSLAEVPVKPILVLSNGRNVKLRSPIATCSPDTLYSMLTEERKAG